METRELILRAAVDAFGQEGSQGATTRRIAARAGVNEVTIFRHFGSKEALLREALTWAARTVQLRRLPRSPFDPAAEIEAWCRAELEALFRARALLRMSMAEHDARPDATAGACEVPARAARELRTYLQRLQEAGMTKPDVDLDAATRMLMGGMLSEAVTRDIMPSRFPDSVDESAAKYARLFTGTVVTEEASRGRGRRRAVMG